jgi:transcriptional regulator with XRE-family HTH domain
MNSKPAIDIPTFLKTVRTKRIDARLNQASLASQIGLKRSQYNRLELTGSGLTVERLNQLVEILGPIEIPLPPGNLTGMVPADTHQQALQKIIQLQDEVIRLQKTIQELRK